MAGGSGGLTHERTKRGSNTNRKKKARAGFSVDLTPLVDITFLLLTFFIFTTTLQEPQAMEMKIPPEVKSDVEVRESELLTLFVTNDDEVKFTYMQSEPALIPDDVIRSVKADFKQEMAQLAMPLNPNDHVKAISIMYNLMEGKRNKMIVALKFEERASYGKIVEVLDDLNVAEGLISYVIANDRTIRDDADIPQRRERRFTLAPLTDDERALLHPEGVAEEGAQ
jgi:biopolymer transport protein ExbD